MRRHFPDHVIAPVHRPIGAEAGSRGWRTWSRAGPSASPIPTTRAPSRSRTGSRRRARRPAGARPAARRRGRRRAGSGARRPSSGAEAAPRGAPARHPGRSLRPAALRLGPAQQGRPAGARRHLRDYLPSPLDLPPLVRPEPADRRGGSPPRRRRGAAPGARVQGLAPRREAAPRVRARLLRPDRRGRRGLERQPRQGGEGLARPPHARRARSSVRRRSALGSCSRWWGSRRRAPATPSPIRPTRCCWSGFSYEPVISQAIEPTVPARPRPLLEALARIADEDPSFRFGEDPRPASSSSRAWGAPPGDCGGAAPARVRLAGPAPASRRCSCARPSPRRRTARPPSSARRTRQELFGRGRGAGRAAAAGRGFRFDFAPEAAGAPVPARRGARPREEGAREAAEAGCSRATRCRTSRWSLTGAVWREGESKPFAYKVAAADAVRTPPGAPAGPARAASCGVEVLVPGELGAGHGGLDARRGTILDVADRGARRGRAVRGATPAACSGMPRSSARHPGAGRVHDALRPVRRGVLAGR